MSAANTIYDVVVVGAGNAALCAAHSAQEEGARVAVLERAPESERGGNSSFAETMRVVYNGVEDVRALCPDLTDQEVASSEFGVYTEENFFDDLARQTQNRTDPDLCEIIVKNSNATLHWMRKNGVRFMPYYGKQAYKIDGRFKFFGGVTISLWGGGQALVDALIKTAQQKGIDVFYDAWVRDLVHSDTGVAGVVVKMKGVTQTINARAVVLACGGFESNPAWRNRHLGPGWDLAKVRGTKYNTGDGLDMALRMGASPFGHWAGCHSVSWDRYATEFGDHALTPQFQRHSYPFSIMVNTNGKRFLDEGADFRNLTYARYGRIVLEQPGQFAYQIFDGKWIPNLFDTYRGRRVTKIRANSVEELADKLEDVNKGQLLKTIKEFNAAVRTDVPFNPNVKDGRCATGLEIPKSNWANPIDTPPFEAYAVTCGVTFTFGGVRITKEAQVMDTNLNAIPGLFAAGEMVGGIFYFGYPGASGLTSGAVFGRVAGRSAARFAKEKRAVG